MNLFHPLTIHPESFVGRTGRCARGHLLHLCAALAMVAAGGAHAAPVAIPNGDFSAATNAGTVGGGLLGGSGNHVPIGLGPWTGTYAGVAGLLAPPSLTISSGAQNASISGLAGLSVLGLVNNGGYFAQTLPFAVQPNTRYIFGADINVGRVLELGLLDNTHTGIALAANNVVLAGSDTAAAGAVTLQPLSGNSYHLSLTYVSPMTIAANALELRLFAQPQGLLTADLLPTIVFDNVVLDTVALGMPNSVGNIDGDGQAATVATEFAVPLGLRVLDGAGNGVAGTQVTFNAPATGAGAVFSAAGSSGTTLAVLTDANGDAQVTATANTVAGDYAVDVTVAGLADPQIFHLTNKAGPAVVVQIPTDGSGGGDQQTMINTPFADALVVEVSDAFGNPVSGVSVSYGVTSAASGAAAVLSATSVLTDADGRTAVDATANSVAGSYSVEASVSGVAATAQFDLTNLAGAPASIAATGGSVQSTTVATPFANPLLVRVVDGFNNPVAGVAVNFSAASAGNGASAVLAATSVVTDADGTASVGATANSFAGTYTVSATVAGVGSAASFQLTNVAGTTTSVVASGGSTQSAEVDMPFAQPLTVQASDAFGNPVANVAVTYAVVPAAGGAAASLSSNTAITAADGHASVIATANSIAGTYSVSASVGASTAASFALTNTAGPPATLVVGGSGSGTQTATVNTMFAQALVVRVEDNHANAVAGVTVNFAAPTSGASALLSATTATTAANGEASVQATANTVAGVYTVSATVAGVATPLTFNLTNTAGTPHDVVPIGGDGSVGGGTTQSAQINTAFPLPLKIRVRDEFQNPVAGVIATFNAPGKGASAQLSAGGQVGTAVSVASDADGEASVIATANSQTGAYTVSARAAGVAATVSYQLTNTPGNSSTPIGGAMQNTVVGTSFECALIVRLADPQGQPRAGIVVDFVAPSSGASALLSDDGTGGTPTLLATTDADGVASVDAIANDIAGKYIVTAQEEGVPTAAVAQFPLQNLDGAELIFKNGFDLSCGGSPTP